jgi:hypothetical protein
MSKFELVDVAYTPKDAQTTKKQLRSQKLEVKIKKAKTPATQQPCWNVYAKKGK